MIPDVRAWAAAAGTVRAFYRHPRQPREVLVAFQNERLRRLVAHAYANVSYYRDVFDAAGVRPADIRTAADLSLIPVTSKATLREVPLRDRVARGVDPAELIAHTTGGSTGEPFTIQRTWLEERVLGFLRRRSLSSYGVRRTDRVAVLLFNHNPAPGDNQLAQHFLGALGQYRVLVLHCLMPVDEMLERLIAFRPHALGGYAGVLARLAHAVEAAGERRVRPRVVLSGAEVLAPQMASSIRRAFGAPVYDTYGCHEFSRIAWQCTTSGEYHLCEDGVVPEVLRDGRPALPGEAGELVGTALHSYAMPFIRYMLADVVLRGSERCACGQPFATLHGIQGRMVDHFPLADGRVLHPYELAEALRETLVEWVRKYQILQERRDRVVLRASATTPPSDELLAVVRERACRVLGPRVEFGIELHTDLALGARGKFRVYRSLVSSEYGPDDISDRAHVPSREPAGNPHSIT